MTVTVYGIKNCDTCRKALKWLDGKGIDYRFHDFRADGLDDRDLAKWISAVGWETLLNRRGTTWRKLPEADREDVDRSRAAGLMLEHPTLIKRPVFDTGSEVIVGFSAKEQAALDGER